MEEKNINRELNQEEMGKISGGEGSGASCCRIMVSLATPRECAEFVQIACRCRGTVTVVHGAKRVDGRKLMALLSLDRSEKVAVELSDPEDAKEFARFM